MTATNHDEYCFFPIGLDNKKRVVIYSNHERATIQTADDNFLHSFRVLEDAFDDSQDVSLCVWVMVSSCRGVYSGVYLKLSL